MRLLLALAAATLCSTSAFAADCATEIKDAMVAAMNSGPMHMESTMTSSAGNMTMSGDIVPPGNMAVKIDTAGQLMEMVTLDGKAWMKMAGVWTELPATAAEQMTASFKTNADPAMLANMQDAQCLGSTNVEGRDLLSYSFGMNQDGALSVNKVFVDPAKKVPVRIETDISSAGTQTRMVVDYTYDAAITVTAPVM